MDCELFAVVTITSYALLEDIDFDFYRALKNSLEGLEV